MTLRIKRFLARITFAALASTMALCASEPPALAQQAPTDAQILDALTAPKRRGISLAPADQARAAEEQRVIEDAMRRQGRGLGRIERDKLAGIADERAKIDLEVNFEYNSAAITPAAMATLMSLGKALSDSRLSGSIFMIGGHTDGKGTAEYNLALSARRAEAVKQFLAEKFKLPPDSLLAVGYGMEQLKDKEHPFAAENRRVQVVNMAPRPTASR
jgi:outer membrane protein OmpA-like peptidoglycan-associated protein